MTLQEQPTEPHYSKQRTKTLQKRLQGIDSQLNALKERFPTYRSYDLGAAFGFTPADAVPSWYREVQRLSRERGEIAAELSKRGMLKPQKGANKEESHTYIGGNIDKLRKECGWSLDKLAEETGIDKKLILSHVNKGARPIPRILKEYAEAFSKALGRRITAPDLEK